MAEQLNTGAGGSGTPEHSGLAGDPGGHRTLGPAIYLFIFSSILFPALFLVGYLQHNGDSAKVFDYNQQRAVYAGVTPGPRATPTPIRRPSATPTPTLR